MKRIKKNGKTDPDPSEGLMQALEMTPAGAQASALNLRANRETSRSRRKR